MIIHIVAVTYRMRGTVPGPSRTALCKSCMLKIMIKNITNNWIISETVSVLIKSQKKLKLNLKTSTLIGEIS